MQQFRQDWQSVMSSNGLLVTTPHGTIKMLITSSYKDEMENHATRQQSKRDRI